MPDKSHEFIGARIRERRESLALGVADLAACAGITLDELADYESGERKVSPSLLIELSRCLDIHVGYFFRDADAASEVASGFAESNPGFASPEEIVRLISAFDSVPDENRRLEIIEFAEDVSRGEPN